MSIKEDLIAIEEKITTLMYRTGSLSDWEIVYRSTIKDLEKRIERLEKQEAKDVAWENLRSFSVLKRLNDRVNDLEKAAGKLVVIPKRIKDGL